MGQAEEGCNKEEGPEVSQVGFRLDPEIASLFRMFELDVKVGHCSVVHRVNTSHHTDEILKFGNKGIAIILIHFLIEQFDDLEIIQAWVYILSWIAEDEKIEGAPKNVLLECPEDIQAWVDWMKDASGLMEVSSKEDEEILGEDQDEDEECYAETAE